MGASAERKLGRILGLGGDGGERSYTLHMNTVGKQLLPAAVGALPRTEILRQEDTVTIQMFIVRMCFVDIKDV